MSRPEKDFVDIAEEQARWAKVWRDAVIEYMEIAQEAEGINDEGPPRPTQKITPNPDIL